MSCALNIFSISDQTNLCFSLLIKLNIDLEQDKKFFAKSIKGVKIKIFGFSENPKNQNYCGDSAIRDLLSTPIQLSLTEGFKKIILDLKNIGYIRGLTFQSISYNYYFYFENNKFKINYYKNLTRLKRLTSK